MPSLEANGDRARILGVAVLVSLPVLLSVPFDLAPLLRGPAPYPPEWRWAFRPNGPAQPLLAAGGCLLGLLVLLAASGRAGTGRHPTAASRGLVAGAVVLGFGLQLALLAREPGHPLQALLSRTRSRSYTSYHTVAISPEARDPAAFLRHHADHLPALARSTKHAATHPPGPVLFYRATLALCEGSPELTDGLLAAAGVPDREFRPPATRPARAAALLGALVLGLLGALAAWPVARLAMALGVAGPAAARLALLWAMLPGPALQTPQFDQALALPIAGAAMLLLTASQRKGGVPWRAVLAGALGGVALFTSYGAAVFLAIGGLAALAAAEGAATLRRALLGAVAAGVAGLTAFGVPVLLGHHPVRAMLTALSIHREIYTTPRSYALWLLFNPLDFALFLGVPVAVTGLLLLPGTARHVASGDADTPITRFRLVTLAGVAALVALGVTRGEVGRIWIPLMPLVLVASLGADGAPDRRESLVHGALLAAFTLVIGSYWVI
jgi:hypothetical protein